jgi:peroxiredoxin
MAAAQYKLAMPDDALSNCDKALSSTTEDSLRASAHALKANILTSLGNDPKRLKSAESEYRAALVTENGVSMLHLDLGVLLLRESQQAEGFQELNTYLRLSPNGDRVEYVKKLLANPRHAADELAPNFQVRTMQGDDISLAQLAGRVVVLDFWATWCPPCVESVPELKDLTKKYPREKLVLLSVSADENEDQWRAFIAKKNMDWSQYWDHDGGIRRIFGVHAFPTYLVIDKDGFIEQRIVGLNPQQSVVARLKTELQGMLSAEGN